MQRAYGSEIPSGQIGRRRTKRHIRVKKAQNGMLYQLLSISAPLCQLTPPVALPAPA